jgi:glycosyltransferase involved in cell wall biosynthesis
MTPDPQLSVLIPAYNEAARLGPAPERLVQALDALGLPWEAVVCDDGSRDGTAAVLADLERRLPGVRGVSHPANRGKGAAVRTAFGQSRGGLVLVLDADGSTGLEALPRFLERAREHAVVIGSRNLPGSRITVPQPAARRLMGRGLRWLVRLALGLRHSDTQCGCKLLSRAAAQEFFQQAVVDGFAWDVELCHLAARHPEWRLVEEPVVWTNHADSRVRLLRDSWRVSRDVLRIRRAHRGLPGRAGR